MSGSNSGADKLTLQIHNIQQQTCADGAVRELNEITLVNQPDPCNTVRIAAQVDLTSEVVEGAVPLHEIADQIAICLGINNGGGGLDTDVSSFTGMPTSATTALLTVTEAGVDRDVFIAGENLEFSGAGTVTDPLLLTVTGAANGVDGVNGIDGINGTNGGNGINGIDITGSGTEDDPLVFRLNVCTLPTRTQTEVDAATSVMLTACVDDETVLIPTQTTTVQTQPISISLELNNDPVVEGVSYNNLQQAYDYADENLQSSGQLNLIIPENTTISGPPVNISGNRMSVSISGENNATSILEETSISVDGGVFEIFNLTANDVLFNIINATKLRIQSVDIDEVSGGGLFILDPIQIRDTTNAVIQNCNIDLFNGIIISNSIVRLSGVDISMKNADETALSASNISSVDIIGGSISHDSQSLASVATVLSVQGSNVIVSNSFTTVNSTTPYSPPANTIGNLGSTIYTV